MPLSLSRRHILTGTVALMAGSANAQSSPSKLPASPLKLLALGDSLTASYGLSHQQGFVAQLQTVLDEHHANTKVLDAGVSGDTSTDALARLDWVLEDQPDAALIELGGNDGLRGLDPARMEANLRAIIARLQNAHIPILVSGMLAPPNMGQTYASQFKAAFDHIHQIPGILYDPFFLQDVAGHPDLQQPDRIHPNPAGVRVIVNRLLPTILTLLHAAHTSQP